MTVKSTIPYVFISSTVKEFRDLRSAIAYTLRLQGFNVYLSEAADFDIRGDRSAFEECFKNINDSDFYILVIGNTRGSLFTDNVSITRQEYRVARETFLTQGRPRLLLYLRRTTEMALSGNEKDAAKSGIDDVNHLASFIKEVESPGIEGAPNYLIRFNDFEDLMTSLANSMNLGRNLSEKLLRHSLLSELLSNLSLMVGVSGARSVLFPTHWYMGRVREEISLTHDDIYKKINITNQQSISLGMSLIGRLESTSLKTRCIEEAIGRGIFLTFNPATSILEETPMHELLRQIISDIDSLRRRDMPTSLGKWSENILNAISEFRHGKIPSLQIQGVELASAFSYYDTTEDLFQEHAALCKVLLGVSDVLPQYQRRPMTPLGEEMDKKLREERVSEAQIAALIQNNINPFGYKYSSVHFGSNREETVKRLAELLRSGEEERGVDMTLFKGAEDIFMTIADSLVSDEVIKP